MKPHKKHVKLSKPRGGKFHHLEFGILGAPCSTIQKLSNRICTILNSEYQLGYVDAEHGETASENSVFSKTYIDEINSHRLDQISIDEFDLRYVFRQCDTVLINGNHFDSSAQIIIINSKKRDSLKRKLDRIKNVEMILLDKNEKEIFPFVLNKLKELEQDPPIFSIEDKDIVSEIKSKIDLSRPQLFGLLLDGGNSSRMGEDKGTISYHGKNHRSYLEELLSDRCAETYISIGTREEDMKSDRYITDTFVNLGPYGGILSAFREFPDSAFLTLPCDAPFIDDELIDYLIKNRNPQKTATAFLNPETEFPEPLITIWEPKSYPVLLHFLSLGYSCPRKVLINSEIELLDCPNPNKLFNANTPEEKKYALDKISAQH